LFDTFVRSGILGIACLSYSTCTTGTPDKSVTSGKRISARRSPLGRHGAVQAQLKVPETMSLTKPQLWLAAIAAALSLAAGASAQEHAVTTSRALPESAPEFNVRHTPFIEPDTFDPD